MALAYDTYYALPRLLNYQQALAHYNRVKPIARDPHETRPLGKRRQKWISIWQDPADKSICAGYGDGKLSLRKPLVRYHPDGLITMPRYNRWSSASCNERVERLLGVEVKTHQYDQWIRCYWHDGGELKSGWLPIQTNPGRRWDGEPVDNHFVRDPSGKLVFLNYVYPVTHRLDKKVWNETLRTFKPFLDYYLNLRKVALGATGGSGRVFSDEAVGEVFGWHPERAWSGKRYPLRPPTPIAHGKDQRAANSEAFFQQVLGDEEARMRAMIAMEDAAPYGCRDYVKFFEQLVMWEHRDSVLIADVHKEGSLVRDKYRSLFR